MAIAVWLAALSAAGPWARAGALVEELPGGSMDWTEHLLVVEVSASPNTGAWRDVKATEQDARAVLAPRLDQLARGLRFSGDERAGDLMGGGDTVSEMLAERLARWRVTEARYYSSGRVHLRAEFEIQPWLSPAVNARAQGAIDPLRPPARSGLVVDARGLEVQPCFAPRLVSPAGEVLYGPSSLDPEIASLEVPAVWVTDPAAAAAAERAGETPWFVVAEAIQGAADLVLGASDQATLASAGPELLASARLVVVVDP